MKSLWMTGPVFNALVEHIHPFLATRESLGLGLKQQEARSQNVIYS